MSSCSSRGTSPNISTRPFVSCTTPTWLAATRVEPFGSSGRPATLAAHSAELFLKAFIVASDGSDDTYRAMRDKSHRLVEVLDLAERYDPSIGGLRDTIAALDRFSGDKIRYVEARYTGTAPGTYSAADMLGVESVRSQINARLAAMQLFRVSTLVGTTYDADRDEYRFEYVDSPMHHTPKVILSGGCSHWRVENVTPESYHLVHRGDIQHGGYVVPVVIRDAEI